MQRFKEEFGLTTPNNERNGRTPTHNDVGFSKEDVMSLRMAIGRLGDDDVDCIDPVYERELLRLADEISRKFRK